MYYISFPNFICTTDDFILTLIVNANSNKNTAYTDGVELRDKLNLSNIMLKYVSCIQVITTKIVYKLNLFYFLCYVFFHHGSDLLQACCTSATRSQCVQMLYGVWMLCLWGFNPTFIQCYMNFTLKKTSVFNSERSLQYIFVLYCTVYIFGIEYNNKIGSNSNYLPY